MQFLFGVGSANDPAVAVVNRLLAEFPRLDARLIVVEQQAGANAKASKLARLQAASGGEFVVISDADVRVPADFLSNLLAGFGVEGVALVNPLYCLANASTTATRWEALSVNADFWTNVLMSRRFGPMRFALGAAMALRRSDLEAVGGFAAIANHLADDYELGRRIAQRGGRVELCPVVVECRESAQGWRAVWRHQLRWSRTIRVCQPAPYAASLISNATLWPLLWLVFAPGTVPALFLAAALGVRVFTAADSQHRLTRCWGHLPWCWLAPVKDLLQVGLWVLAFTGDAVEWRGRRYRVRRSGELVPHDAAV
jgi:ceramide glucosyltransferase